MKHLKKVMALVIAAMMIASMAVSAYAANKITINQNTHDKAEHTYGAYQIFAGTVDEQDDTVLTNITWGANVDESKLGTLATELNALRDASTATPAPEFDDLTATSIPAAFAAAIGKLESGDDTATAQAIAESLSKIITGDPTTGAYTTDYEVYEIDGLDDGYYLIQDTEDPTLTDSSDNSGAKTRYILKLVNDVTVTEKADAPSVDKEVKDEAGDKDTESLDADGWGETADHAINESFQFKLTATIPAETDLAKYEGGYKIVFTDTMSKGVTFESIESVKINSSSIPAYEPATTGDPTPGYKLSDNAVAGLEGQATWTLTIDDITVFNPVKTAITAGNDVEIEVIYNAHLNKDAKVYDEECENEQANNNKVKLTYSNNPNAGGEGDTGDTPEDYVWVFTYKVDNTKYSESIDPTHYLADAGFTLKDSTGAVVKLVLDDDQYRPATAEEIAAAAANATWEMKSQSDGTFNIIGLDIGTYTLVETTVPAGFNKVADITIEIEAGHKENASTAGADLTFTKSENIDNSIVNKTGTVLPSTGGIGTTLFYVIGAILVLGAGVLLITRRRMNAN